MSSVGIERCGGSGLGGGVLAVDPVAFELLVGGGSSREPVVPACQPMTWFGFARSWLIFSHCLAHDSSASETLPVSLSK